MAILPIVQYPDPRLATVCEPVTQFDDALKALAADMAETMYHAPGVGLAAPQIGRNIRMVVIDTTDDHTGLRTYVNPRIEVLDATVCEFEEGCLSLPGLYEKISRPTRVRIHAQDLDGVPFSVDCEGVMAVCAQHETDHLNGQVFIDHLSRLKKDRARAKLAKKRRESARAKDE